jgi:hypothetical protein
VIPIPAGLALIPAHEEILEQVTEKLKGYVLEGEGGSVEELKQVYAILQMDERRDVLSAKCRITPADKVLEIFGRDLGGRNVERQDIKC